jgi:saccharopine dehydrogenase-like NADP-dependent oxidoreductase
MTTVLLIGGSGRIGSSIALDLLQYTSANLILTGRNLNAGLAAVESLGDRTSFQALDLADLDRIRSAIAHVDLVIHTAGPFYTRSTEVLESCIEQRVNYLDVSDERSFTSKALAQREAAKAAGVTAIVNTGVFPGISNSMARQGVEKLDKASGIHLSYLVAGSGGAGVTVMRTTFIGLQRSFAAWLDGRWQTVKPYSDRETLDFPPPYGKAGVYWYDMPEALTLAETFPVDRVITKFGIVPDFYNHLTWMAANLFPSPLLQSSATVEFLSQVSYRMTNFTDRFSGTGVAVRCEVSGEKEGREARYHSTFSHENAAIATGYGTGSLAQLLLEGKLSQPGVWPVEQVLSTDLFEQTMQERKLEIPGKLSFGKSS